jgi:photosystem II stability/assembly factor-like uncharacterized protein
MTIPLSHGGGETILTGAKPSTAVLIGTVDGVVRLERVAEVWSVTHRSLQGQHVHALVREPDSGVWFAGISKGGIHASQDDGRSWTRRDAGLTQQDIYSLSVTKVDGRPRVWAGTQPPHLFVTDDLGLTWTEKSALRRIDTSKWSFPAPPHIAHLKHINFAPGDPRTIFASIEVGGLYKSPDAGESFMEIPGLYEDVHRTVIDPRNTDRLYVTGGMGLWLSTDAGATWTNTFGRGSEYGGYPDQLVFKPSDPSYMIVSAGQKSPGSWRTETAGSRFSRSRDGGVTWEVLRNGLQDLMPHSVEAMTLEETADGITQLFAGTTGGEILWSTDAGETWSTVIRGLAPVSKGAHYRNIAADAPRQCCYN